VKPLFRSVAGLTGAIVAVESLALLLGTHLIAYRAEWAVPKNSALIAADVLGGAWLVYEGARGAVSGAFYVVAVTLLLTHAYREWEYLAGMAGAFCANRTFFAFDTVRMLGLAAILV
jgi:hypothetical protein